ncbi:tryptophan halogenase [Haloferula luteola]|uniref:Tryptophan halogenase n=1 Tax=Haloferula luteola TaxID=595692 RepID=A0A840UYF9_9BACT|nr:tryptophan halogenase family protein [Haloferula luteola]MBB5350775.1 tryptophan halogenase [Haloferula luteola]
MIQKVLVVGSGSAGLIAALSLKKKIPRLEVKIVRDPDLGVIGVGEGTTPNFPTHLFDYLGISRGEFYRRAEPTWKLGIRFDWGPRGRFDYTFGRQLDSHWPGLERPVGFYCDDEFSHVDLPAALMREDKVFLRQANGCPDIQPWHAFHIENEKFVEVLESYAAEWGVEITDGKLVSTEQDATGITALVLGDGRRLEADFFVDASGFRSELMGRALEEPFEPFDKTLFCDRAVVGGWERTREPILPYTTAEQMDVGWCWRIEHEHRINRGYVYCSDMISDEEAAAEFRRKNPKAPESPRVVRFRSGAYQRMWVKNVVAIGNAAGFVEPLEATALMVVCSHSRTLIDFLLHCELEPTPSMVALYNEQASEGWKDIRDFLGLHYQLNTAGKTDFWRRCREETDLSGIASLLEFYRENGPTGFCRYRTGRTNSDFGIEGYLVMLVGQQAPYEKRHPATPEETTLWRQRREQLAKAASGGLTVAEALAYIRHPAWEWHGDSRRKAG